MFGSILTTVGVGSVPTEAILVAGKMGKVFAYRAADGKHLWTRSVGKHQNDTGPLPRQPTTIFPGDYGGVETPMALAGDRLFVPWNNFSVRASATGLAGSLEKQDFKKGKGGFSALDPASGAVLWQRKLPSLDFGAATVANDVVFTSTYAGTVYAFDTRTGKTLWTARAPAGINSFPAIDGDTLLVGAGTPGFSRNPRFELVAYALPPETQARASATTDRVKAKEFSFRVSAKSVASPRRVTFRVRNAGHLTHNLKINGRRTPDLQPGHAAAGMRGVFTVR